MLLFAFCTTAVAAKPTITFNKTKYRLAYVQQGSVNSINEYVPKGQNLKNWKSLIGVFQYHQHKDTSPLEFAQLLGKSLQASNPKIRFQIMNNEKTNEAVIDFLTWNKKDPKNAEFNIFKFKKDPNNNEIIGLQYASRLQPNTNKKFVEKFKRERSELIIKMIKQKFPEFVTKKQ